MSGIWKKASYSPKAWFRSARIKRGQGLQEAGRQEEGVAELEIHHEHEGKDDPVGKKIGVLASALAVLLAIVTIQGHRAHTDAILNTAKASDQWNYYQAKKLKGHNLELGRDMISALAPKDAAEASKKVVEYNKGIARYEKESETAAEDAHKLEKNAERAEHKAFGFDLGEGLLEIGLVLTSLYFIARKMLFPAVGVIAGIAGVIAAVSGLISR